MDINALNANLNRDKWGVRNFRALKSLLVKEVQESLSEFMPLTSSSYYNNPIQVLDFFSGAGGTSLGFAALNTVIPTFKMLGGCDINQISAQTYSRNFDTPVISVFHLIERGIGTKKTTFEIASSWLSQQLLGKLCQMSLLWKMCPSFYLKSTGAIFLRQRKAISNWAIQ